MLEILELTGVLYKEENLVRSETAEKEQEHLQCWGRNEGTGLAGREISCQSRLPGTGRPGSHHGCGEWWCSSGEVRGLTLRSQRGARWLRGSELDESVDQFEREVGVGWLGWVERALESQCFGRLGDHFNGCFVQMVSKFLLLSFLPFRRITIFLFQCG